MKVAEQLEIFGLDGTKQLAIAGGASRAEKNKLLRRIEVAHDLMSGLPSPEDLAFLHSGLCQTCLPHSRPASNKAVWTRASGRFSLMVSPGMIDDRPAAARHRQPTPDEQEAMYVGVPYGSRARLILLFLQSEGVKSRAVSLGPSLSAWLRSLGLPISGGPRGSISAIREQSLRIARCSMTMQWTDRTEGGEERTIIADTRIVDGMELWRSASGEEWCGTIELSEHFFQQLRQHAVPLDRRGIAHLAGNSLGLDLYALLAYRLPRLQRDLHLRWDALQAQVGAAETQAFNLAYRIRAVLPDLAVAYPHARVEVTPHGLLLKPSPPAVPKTAVPGFRIIEG
jgi:Plasmid encoded RepA protein